MQEVGEKTMAQRALMVRIDDRVRLMSAVLSVTDWGDRAQNRKRHRPHAHARNTSKWLANLQGHPAVVRLQHLLNQGAPLEALYAYALKLAPPELHIENPPRWAPPDWNQTLLDFYFDGQLYELWSRDLDAWEKSVHEATEVMRQADFYNFLYPFVGVIQENLVYMPNISYPSDMAIGVRVGGEVLCIGHPRIAWGDNPPWPFDEDPAHVYSTSLNEYTRLLMLGYLRRNAEAIAPITQKELPVDEEFKRQHPSWGDQFLELVVPACVAMYLEQYVSQQEAKSFILMEKKLRGVTILPGVMSVLYRYLEELKMGKVSNFVEFLPNFGKYLRVAKTISAI
jgi:hypothetical protein